MSRKAMGSGKHIPPECQYLFTKIQSIAMTISFTCTVTLTPYFKNIISLTPFLFQLYVWSQTLKFSWNQTNMLYVVYSLNKLYKQRKISVSLQITMVTMVVNRDYDISNKDSSVYKYCATGDCTNSGRHMLELCASKLQCSYNNSNSRITPQWPEEHRHNFISSASQNYILCLQELLPKHKAKFKRPGHTSQYCKSSFICHNCWNRVCQQFDCADE